jgi:predicted dehydrogenase
VSASRAPRLGFLGVGWIGRHRMQAIAAEGHVEVAAIADASAEALEAAAELAPRARLVSDLDALLELDLDGMVIATPSGLHAAQSLACLAQGLAVFCQKPLGRTATETETVVRAAREADRLLAVDLSYRHTAAFAALRDLVAKGELGEIYAVDLEFHNAYGPDKAWFYDPVLSGGGCVMDLGIHLTDAALWLLDFPSVREVSSRLFLGGAALSEPIAVNEDFAQARMDLDTGAVVQLACSWGAHSGRDAVISARVHGTKGGAAVHNVDGSFYDFVADRYDGTRAERLVEPPDAWGGRAACAFARRLAESPAFDPEAAQLTMVARALDLIYRRL